MKSKLTFPENRPVCCGISMYACGGIIGKRPDNEIGDVEHQWRCEICGNEITDVLAIDEKEN
jgi:hypothetical protein